MCAHAAAPRRRRHLRLFLLLCALALFALACALIYPSVSRNAMYSTQYEDLVDAAAREFGLDRAHIYAVIQCESGFRKDAVSSAGAMGLMQIMPETGQCIAGKFGEEELFAQDMLFEPEMNIRYGCWLLSYLSGRYGGDMDTVSAAYHAGIGNVGKWLDDAKYSADGLTIDTTPFPGTNRYMEKVRKAYEVYAKKLAKEA